MITRRQGIMGAAGVALAVGAAAFGTKVRAHELRQAGRLHIPRYGPALCTDGQRAILSGGAPIGAGQTEQHFYSSLLGLVEAIDPATLDQQFLANAIHHRANHASIWIDNQIWLLGGRTRDGTQGRLVSETERIDPETQAIWRGPDLPVPLIHLATVTLADSVFVLGGVYRPEDGSHAKASNQVWECAYPYDAWTQRATMPVAIGNSAAIVLGDRIFLIGGYDQSRALAILQVYDPTTDAWSMSAPPPIPLSAHAAAAGGGRIFVFGDYANQSSVLGFDPATEEWRKLAIPFTPRRHVRAVTVKDKIIVAGGNQASVAPATHALESYSMAMLNAEYDRAGA